MRCEMVREQAKKETKDRNMARKARWFNCALTQQRLNQPIVSCRKGRLYNKEAVIEHILGITPNKLITPHIKKSKHIKTLNLTTNPVFEKMASTTDVSLCAGKTNLTTFRQSRESLTLNRLPHTLAQLPALK